jgi:ribosomal protein S18 acetylase RimI-like enzyme
MSKMIIDQGFFPAWNLPAGFKLKSLEEGNNLQMLQRVLWRGFDHPGEPPLDELHEQQLMQSGPHYRKDLKIVVEAPNGNFAAFCRMWYDDHKRIAYIEPVATDPDDRRMGLGRAAVLEGMRRCGALGAGLAFVGSD